MNFRTTTLAVAIGAMASTTYASTVTFTQSDLVAGTEDGTFSDVEVVKDGVTLNATASPGAVRIYSGFSGEGLYFGAITSGALNTTANTTSPASGSYGLTFDQAVSSVTFVIDYLTKNAFGEEVISMFSTDNGAVTLAAANYTNGGGTSLDVGAQTINTTTARGKGTLTYAGPSFNSFFFDHSQDPRNIGFTVTSVSVELAPVPLPAALPMLAVAMGGFAAIRRKQRGA